jgi:hypothetical protein
MLFQSAPEVVAHGKEKKQLAKIEAPFGSGPLGSRNGSR